LIAAVSEASVIAVLEVEESWKGVHGREVELDVGNGFCCNCTFGAGFFAPGTDLLVYAYEDEGTLAVSTCGPPVRIEYAGPHLELLGPGERALGSGRTGYAWSFGLPIVAATFGLVFVLWLLSGRRGSERVRAGRD
jgi:hypothetical protein